jgi:seryl-tRNA synthetase
MNNVLFSIPNIPDPDIPLGKDENDNVELRKVNKPKKFTFPVKSHYELGEALNILDFDRAVKLAGSRQTIFKGDGARLLRALRNYTLDLHLKNNYIEIQPPVIINPEILYGTGHLPKAKDDMFELSNGKFLSPTEEIPLTGYYRNETIKETELPIKLTASTLSFRSEAGSAGKDMRGIIRQHQFYNTEMVVLCKEEESAKQLELLTKEAESILKSLKLPYRVILLCTGDMGSAAVKTYDIEV